MPLFWRAFGAMVNGVSMKLFHFCALKPKESVSKW